MRSHQPFDHEASDDVRMREAVVKAVHGHDRVGQDELGPVDQCQASLGMQLQRRETLFLQHRRGVRDLSLVKDLSFSDQGKKKVCQGSQVP